MQRAEKALKPALDTAPQQHATGRTAATATQAGIADQRPMAAEQRELMQLIAQSPRVAAQRALNDSLHKGAPMHALREGGIAQAMRASGGAPADKPYKYAVRSAHWAQSRDDAHATGKQAVDQGICQRIYQKHRDKAHEGKCVSYLPTNREGCTLMVVSYAKLGKGVLTLDTAYITNAPNDPEGAAITFNSTTQIALPVAAAMDGPIPGETPDAPLSKNQKRSAKRKAKKLAQDNNLANNNNE